jgi:hypothetical protein
MRVVMVIRWFLMTACVRRVSANRITATRCSALIDTRLIDTRRPRRVTGSRASLCVIEHDRFWLCCASACNYRARRPLRQEVSVRLWNRYRSVIVVITAPPRPGTRLVGDAASPPPPVLALDVGAFGRAPMDGPRPCSPTPEHAVENDPALGGQEGAPRRRRLQIETRDRRLEPCGRPAHTCCLDTVPAHEYIDRRCLIWVNIDQRRSVNRSRHASSRHASLSGDTSR